jgi:hypothetical protein
MERKQKKMLSEGGEKEMLGVEQTMPKTTEELLEEVLIELAEQRRIIDRIDERLRRVAWTQSRS